MDYRTERALNGIHERDPDLAHVLSEVLEMLAERKVHQAPRLDLSRLATPQGLLFGAGGIALLLQVPLPTIIETLKAVSPFILP